MDEPGGLASARNLGVAERRRVGARALVVWSGYAAATLAPLLVCTLWLDDAPLSGALGSSLVLGAIWLVALHVGFADGKTTLATLGARVGILRGTALGLAAAVVTGVWWARVEVEQRTLFAAAAGILVLNVAWSYVVERRLRRPTRVLLVGRRETCEKAVTDLKEAGGFVVVGIVGDDGLSGDPLTLGPVAALGEVVADVRPDLVAIAPEVDRQATFAGLLDVAFAGFRVLELAQLYEHALGRVPVTRLNRAWFMSVLHLYQRPYSRLAKRTTDVLGALIVIVLTVPLFPLLLLLVRSSRGPILIKQERIGEHGRTFTMYKFRTMRADAERLGEAVWASADDPRVTLPGRIMRRLRLDELPQTWNVLKGEMSLVGPRPERPEFIDDLVDVVPFWSRRHLVKPGITGWAQIKHGYTADAAGTLDKLSYDLWYLRHRSLTVDLVICARTFKTALLGDPFAASRHAPGPGDGIPVLVRFEPDHGVSLGSHSAA